MQKHHEFILKFLAARPNRNMPATKLFRQYGMHFAWSTFDDALRYLIDAGMVERVPPLHVRLK